MLLRQSLEMNTYNPWLTKNPDSLKRSIVNVAAIGLTLNPVHGLAYLMPRKSRVCLDISYKGIIALAVHIGSIKWAMSEVVRENDTFKMQGIGEKPIHEFNPFDIKRGKILGGYCVAKLQDGEFLVRWMPLDKIHKQHRDRSEAWKAYESGKTKNKSPWHTDEEEMILKSLVRSASKYWPKTSTHARFNEVESTLEEVDQLEAPLIENTAERKDKFNQIEYMLLELNIDKDYYIKETLPKIARRQIDSFGDLTDGEIDMIIVQLDQMIKEKK